MTKELQTQTPETVLPSGGAPPVDTPVTDGVPGTPAKPNIPETVPYDRFQEVNEEKKNLREQNERLLTILQSQGAKAATTAAQPIAQEEKVPELLPLPVRSAFTKDNEAGYEEFNEAAYLEALGKATQENALRMVRHEHQKETNQAENQRRAKQGQELLQTISTKHPDFPSLMIQSQPSQAVMDALYALDEDDRMGAAETAYHLAQNPAEMARLNAMAPAKAIAAVGKLLAKLTTPVVPAKVVSDAPSPSGPVKTTEVPENFDPLKSTSKEYAAHHPMADKVPWLKT